MSIAHSPLSILFVEDNLYLRETLAMMLEADDREVVPCANAEEASTELDKRQFDVLLTDVSLPGRSGIDLARSVLTQNPAAWIIFSSGYSLDHGLSALGPNVRSLSKPFEFDAMDALLDEARAARA